MSVRRFKTFEGVFTPTLLSILGVIMYLRLGWVVGKAGLGAALLIIFLANLITLATALSMSSIVTNIRIGAGGAYSIIAKSLGIEVGGAIGIPLYLSQAISVAFYITGFTECWRFVFPQYDLTLSTLIGGSTISLVSLVLWSFIFVVSYISTKLAFKLQYVIMAIVGLSLVSIFLGQGHAPQTVTSWQSFQMGSFWPVFAIFFPAVTGVLAGASMSGELVDPRKSIPRGTLNAIGVSFCVYLAMAVWFSKAASPEELISNTTIIINLGRWKWPVVAGIMGATVSSAIAMAVGSPRTLFALGRHAIVPFSKTLVRVNKKGEPTSAILLSAFLVLITLLLGTLDQVAGLLTMIFLITYGMINLVVFIEQSLGIVSFRPSFRIPRFVSFFGAFSCLLVMFLINMSFSIVAFILIVGIYFVLLRRTVKIHSPDVRSALLIFLAEKFAVLSARLPYYPKIWKPNILVLVDEKKRPKEVLPLIEDVISPAGRIYFFEVITDQISGEGREKRKEQLEQEVDELREKKFFVETGVVEADDRTSGSVAVMQVLGNTLFPPNTLFYVLGQDYYQEEAQQIIGKAAGEGYGIVVYKESPEKQLGQRSMVNLWVRQGSPNIDLAILIALQLKNNWEGDVRVLLVIDQEDQRQEAQAYLEKLRKVLRMPLDTETNVLSGHFLEALKGAPAADVNIFGMPHPVNLALVEDVASQVKTTVLFLRDSEHESAVA